jgi:hypothetical protein
MAFTTREIVKKHILDRHLGSDSAEDEPVVLTGTDYARLRHKSIIEESEKVKGKEQIEPTREDIDFQGSDDFNLSHGELIRETVVMAGDSSLGIIYIENVDYHIDYNAGRVSRIADGSIPAGGSAVVWYLYYRVYQRGSDYDLDYRKGSIRRRSGGDIESGQRVLVDYTAEFSGLDDEAMDNAIAEANERILSYIDDAHHDSTDRALVTAETYLALSIVCRARAMETISPSKNLANRAAESKSWVELSNTYKKEAYVILSKFSGAIGSLKPPTKA